MDSPNTDVVQAARGLQGERKGACCTAVSQSCLPPPLAHPPRPPAPPPLQRRTALHLAAWAGQVDCLKALLAAGADINAAAQDDMNALHFAAVKGQTEATRWLLNSGAGLGLLIQPASHMRSERMPECRCLPACRRTSRLSTLAALTSAAALCRVGCRHEGGCQDAQRQQRTHHGSKAG